jgi:LuxR family maltose regulon positive regulatory protein
VATKLRAPTLPGWLLTRPRLVSLLDEAVAAGVVLVSAPAGYGKTMAVSEWVDTLPEPAGWLSVDPADSDPVRFWRYLLAAVDTALPGTSRQVGPVPSGGALALNAAVASLINVLAADGRRVVVVIDDHDAIDSPTVDSTFGYLLAYRPANLELVLTTRSIPSLPVDRLRVEGELREIGAADLRFRPEEVGEYLRSLPAATRIPREAIEALADRTEGWPAGIHLAALTLDGHRDPAAVISSFSGSHRYVVDFLANEVLAHQTPVVRRFLEETSLLDRLTAGLCAAVTGREDSQSLLEEIERSNLFLEPLDDRREWWRYHRLFAHALRDRIENGDPERASEIHRRAARWHREKGLADEAIAHALAAGEIDWAAKVVEEHVDELFLVSERSTLERWLRLFSNPVREKRPRMLLAQARLALQQGNPASAAAWLDKMEEALDGIEGDRDGFEPSVGATLSITANPPAALALNRAIAAEYSGEPQSTLRLLGEAMALAGDDEIVLRAIARGHMGIAEWLEGRLDTAETHLEAADRLCWIADQPSLSAWVGYYRGAIALARGDLRSAEETYRRILEVTAPSGSPVLPAAGVAHVGLAVVALERDELADARRHLEDGLPLCRGLAFSPPWATGLATLARLKWALADVTGAMTVLDREGREAAPRHPVVSLLDPIRAERARIASVHGDDPLVAGWAASGSRSSASTYLREAEDLAESRIPIRRDAHSALSILSGLAARASAEGRLRSLIEIRLVEAAARMAISDSEGARHALAEALEVAATTGHVRLFAEQGVEFGELLAEHLSIADTATASQDHLHRIRAAMARTGSPRAQEAQSSLIDPLSARELEVLQLVAAGRSNSQIAEDLYIAVDTVKRHLTHILAKLGAANRTEAAARARRLGLVD